MSFSVFLLVGYLMETQTYHYSEFLETCFCNAEHHSSAYINGCVATYLYTTLPRFKSKMALVWDRPIQGYIAHLHDDVEPAVPQMHARPGDEEPDPEEASRAAVVVPV